MFRAGVGKPTSAPPGRADQLGRADGLATGVGAEREDAFDPFGPERVIFTCHSGRTASGTLLLASQAGNLAVPVELENSGGDTLVRGVCLDGNQRRRLVAGRCDLQVGPGGAPIG